MDNDDDMEDTPYEKQVMTLKQPKELRPKDKAPDDALNLQLHVKPIHHARQIRKELALVHREIVEIHKEVERVRLENARTEAANQKRHAQLVKLTLWMIWLMIATLLFATVLGACQLFR